MKSTSGAHYIALDHVRALAAFMVFTWHFTHASSGYPVPFEFVPTLFPMSILDEGHTGVALFMTLSGYLFAKLLENKSISYPAFLWNRALRLLPLLVIVIALVGIRTLFAGEDLIIYAKRIAQGLMLPSLPNGGWSITVEFHYYLLIPLLLWMLRRSKFLPILIIIAAVALRILIHEEFGEVQKFAYKTILGRIDQFVFGMLAFQLRSYLSGRHAFAIGILVGFMVFYWYFDYLGGYWNIQGYPSASPIWIILPTIEGFAYAIGIAWYDSSFFHVRDGLSKLVGRMGEYSYSIYLFHFFFVYAASRYVNDHIMSITNFYLACLWSFVCYCLMFPIGYLSFRFLEAPFLGFRRNYILSSRDSRQINSPKSDRGGIDVLP